MGEAEAVQFVRFILDSKDRVTADEFLKNKKTPEDPSEISILINALVEKVSFLADTDSANELFGP